MLGFTRGRECSKMYLGTLVTIARTSRFKNHSNTLQLRIDNLRATKTFESIIAHCSDRWKEALGNNVELQLYLPVAQGGGLLDKTQMICICASKHAEVAAEGGQRTLRIEYDVAHIHVPPGLALPLVPEGAYMSSSRLPASFRTRVDYDASLQLWCTAKMLHQHSGSYFEDYKRQKSASRVAPGKGGLENERLLTDRAAYISFLEVQLERVVDMAAPDLRQRRRADEVLDGLPAPQLGHVEVEPLGCFT